MISDLERLRTDDGGATAVEYALLIAAVAAVLVAVAFALGLRVSAAFNNMDSRLGAYLP